MILLGLPFHAVVVFTLDYELLFKFILGYCGFTRFVLSIDLACGLGLSRFILFSLVRTVGDEIFLRFFFWGGVSSH